MQKKNARPASSPFSIEPLEDRRMLSATVATTTAISVSAPAANFGIPVSMTATVRARGGGTPQGMVEFLYFNGKKYTTFSTANLTHTGHATIAFPGVGGQPLYAGNYNFAIRYLGNDTTFIGSKTKGRTVAVTVPNLTTVTGGTQICTTVAGSGTATAKAGDHLTVKYSGFLKNGGILFDDSDAHPASSPFAFQLGVGAVIHGWDMGVVGMKVGESRLMVIPAAEAYGANAQPGIPANSDLVFLVTVVSIT